jgi:hypothetical protein
MGWVFRLKKKTSFFFFFFFFFFLFLLLLLPLAVCCKGRRIGSPAEEAGEVGEGRARAAGSQDAVAILTANLRGKIVAEANIRNSNNQKE